MIPAELFEAPYPWWAYLMALVGFLLAWGWLWGWWR